MRSAEAGGPESPGPHASYQQMVGPRGGAENHPLFKRGGGSRRPPQRISDPNPEVTLLTDRTGARIDPLFFNPVSIQTPGEVIHSGHFCTTPSATRRLDEILEPHGMTGEGLLFRLGGEVARMGVRPPWATIVLPKHYILAEHFLTLREGPEQLSLSTFDLEPCEASDHAKLGALKYARVGILTFWRKQGLAQLEGGCPFLGATWGALGHLSEAENFLVCAPEPHPTWLHERAKLVDVEHELAKAVERMSSSLHKLIQLRLSPKADRT